MPVPKGKAGVKQVMHEFKHHQLHSGSSHGPLVTNPRQAVAIAMNASGQGWSRGKRSKGHWGQHGNQS